MPGRKPRAIEPGGIYHLMSRFVAKEWFIESNEERIRYWELFGAAIIESDWKCFSSCVMSNHLHHGLVAGRMTVKELFGPMHSMFADWMNERRGRIGQVFMRGPKDMQFEPEGVATLVSYIHDNPVRAGIVADASDTGWSTQRAWLGLEERPAWLDVDLGLRLGGFRDGSSFESWHRARRVTRDQLHAFQRHKPLRGRPAKTRVNEGMAEAGQQVKLSIAL